MIVTDAFRLASSVASNTADVDLPAPPLELAKEIVGMAGDPIRLLPANNDVIVASVCQQSSNRRLLTKGRRVSD
jgi:hypothetical protein